MSLALAAELLEFSNNSILVDGRYSAEGLLGA